MRTGHTTYIYNIHLRKHGTAKLAQAQRVTNESALVRGEGKRWMTSMQRKIPFWTNGCFQQLSSIVDYSSSFQLSSFVACYCTSSSTLPARCLASFEKEVSQSSNSHRPGPKASIYLKTLCIKSGDLRPPDHRILLTSCPISYVKVMLLDRCRCS